MTERTVNFLLTYVAATAAGFTIVLYALAYEAWKNRGRTRRLEQQRIEMNRKFDNPEKQQRYDDYQKRSGVTP